MPLYTPPSPAYCHASAGGTSITDTYPTTERWYAAGRLNPTTASTVTVTANRAVYLPILGAGINLAQLAIGVTTGGGAGNGRLSVYDNISDSILYPGNLLYDSGTFSTSGSGIKYSTPSPATPTKKGALYWIGASYATAPIVNSLVTAALWPILGDQLTASTTFGLQPGVGWEDPSNSGLVTSGYPATAASGLKVLVPGTLPTVYCRFGT